MTKLQVFRPDFPTVAVPGTGVRYRLWPAGRAQAVILMIHGMGAHSGRWDYLARGLNAKGIAAAALELRGHGATPGPRGHAGFNAYFRDAEALYAEIRKKYPRQKIFLMGESMGGLIAYHLAALHPDWFAGLIAISPAFRNVMKFRVLDYLLIVPYLLFSPRSTIRMPFTAAMITRNPDEQRALEADPLELRVASARLLVSILNAQARAPKAAARIQGPALFLLSGRDFLTDPQASRSVFQRLAGEGNRLIEYPDMHHALSIDVGREKILADLLAWIGKPVKKKAGA